MKEMSIEQFASDPSGSFDASQGENLLVTKDGKPLAWVIGYDQTKDEEDLAFENSAEFWEMLERSRVQVGIPLEEAKEQLFPEDHSA